MKKIFAVLLALLIIGLVAYSLFRSSRVAPNPMAESTTTGSATVVNTETPSTDDTPSYTLAEVATHATETNCWTAINGDVYDLTAWIAKHPGGKQAIIGLCGRDGSGSFNAQHGGRPQQENTLATFKIGILK